MPLENVRPTSIIYDAQGIRRKHENRIKYFFITVDSVYSKFNFVGMPICKQWKCIFEVYRIALA